MIRKEIIIFLIMSISLNLIAQSDNHWNFSYNRLLSFNSEPPSYLYPKKFHNEKGPNYYSNSNINGDLQFYGSMDSIFNSKSQPVVILPSSTLEKKYLNYLIQVSDTQYFLFYHLHYFFLDTFMLGFDIISRKGDSFYFSKANNMVGQWPIMLGLDIVKIDEFKYWLVLHAVEGFYAYKIENSAVNEPVFTGFRERKNEYLNGGNISFSNDGSFLVSYCNGNDYVDGIKSVKRPMNGTWIYAYDFNINNGKLSNQRNIFDLYAPYDSDSTFVFLKEDVIFSPNDSLFYITVWPQNTKSNYFLFQFQRYATDISSSLFCMESVRIKNDSSKFPKYSAPSTMRLAPNGKIYYLSLLHYFDFLGCIYYPDSVGEKCRIIPHALLNGKKDIYPVGYISKHFEKYRRVSFQQFNNPCQKKLRFKNISDSSFKSFEWFVYKGDALIKNVKETNTHIYYQDTGWYYVKLKATDRNGYSAWYSDTFRFTGIYKNIDAGFYTDTNIWCQHVKMKFYDSSITKIKSKNKQSWLWDFGDGTTSTLQNPEHVFTNSGLYNIKLIYSNGYCHDTIVKQNVIKIVEAPKPGFLLNKNNYCAPDTIYVSNNAKGEYGKIDYHLNDSVIANHYDFETFAYESGNYKIFQKVYGATGCITYDSANIWMRKGYDGTEVSLINFVTVEDTQKVTVQWTQDATAASYELLKGKTPLVFEKSKSEFNDPNVNTFEEPYYYQLKMIDSCGRCSRQSNVHNSILLEGKNIENQYAKLEFNPYPGWENELDKYGLLDITYSPARLVAELPPEISGSLIYEDRDYFEYGETQKCYQAIARHKNGTYSSVSNPLCLEYIPQFWIPNAFTPNNDGLNDELEVKHIGMVSYEMLIYNRWGEQVAKLNTNQSWDGKVDGKALPMDVYYYSILFYDQSNAAHTSKGIINLIR
jgi:gliding motility-associated-like protein